MYYKESNFRICSGSCDEILFFNSEYQEQVREAINKIMESVPYSKGMILVCNRAGIEIKDGNNSYFEPLGAYDENIRDIELYTFESIPA